MTDFHLSRRMMVSAGLAGLSFASPVTRALAQGAENRAILPSGGAPADESAPVDVMTMDDKIQRLTAPVMINGQGPFDFFLDTGATRSAISSGLAAQLGLARGAPVKVYTMTGAQETPTVMLDALQVGDRVQRRLTVPVLPTLGLRADGVLGVDWLKGERLTIDFMKERLEIRKPGRDTMASGGSVVPARLRSGQLTIIDAEMNGRGTINAMIDTGSEVSIGNDLLRALAGRENAKFEDEMRFVDLVDASNRQFKGELGYLPFVRIGGVQFGNLCVVFASSMPLLKLWGMDKQPSVMMGMDVMRQFAKVEMDFGQSKVGFTMRKAQA